MFIAAQAYTYADVCLIEALDWACTFGEVRSQRQVVRRILMYMLLQIDAARSFIYDLTFRIEHGCGDPTELIAHAAMAKVIATHAMQICADQGLQFLGGTGYMRGTCSERIYREVKVMMIGCGSKEIMKDLGARQLRVKALLRRAPKVIPP